MNSQEHTSAGAYYLAQYEKVRDQLKQADKLLSDVCRLGLPLMDQCAYEAVKAMQRERDALAADRERSQITPTPNVKEPDAVALRAERERTIEQCALIADKQAAGWGEEAETRSTYEDRRICLNRESACQTVAERIRALAAEQTEGKP